MQERGGTWISKGSEEIWGGEKKSRGGRNLGNFGSAIWRDKEGGNRGHEKPRREISGLARRVSEE